MRYETPDGTCKYSAIDNRTAEIIEGKLGSDKEFFLIMLKDRHAPEALRAYADSVVATGGDQQYAADIYDMAYRAENHPNQKDPD